ncbi:MAG: S-layer homology domain-containing protein [Synergistaceae bacterium]|nr:S-layer homology domain-containing protein [Synergistaceae bacterium]
MRKDIRTLSLILIAASVMSLALSFSSAAQANPFSDIPAGHWAYDAANMLASQGIMTGYGELFKGRHLITRYEMASALARSLAKADLKHATQAQLKMIQNMTAELSEELDALGVTLDKTDRRLAKIEERLGGWSLSGSVNFDANFMDGDAGDPANKFKLARFRLNIMRSFGEKGDNYFYAQMDNYRQRDDKTYKINEVEYSSYFSKVYADFGLGSDWRMRVGLFSVDYETSDMVYSTGRFGEYSQGAWLTDINKDAIAVSKSFNLGYFSAYAYGRDRFATSDDSMGVSALVALQFNEKLALNIGFDHKNVDNETTTLDSLTTIWVAPKYEITPNIGLRGAYYTQFAGYSAAETYAPDERPSAWRVLLDVKQRLLKYTSLWVEYNKIDKNFVMTSGSESLMLSDHDQRDFFSSNNIGGDLEIFRIGLNQVWSKRWSSWLYYAKYKFSNYPILNEFGNIEHICPEMDEISAGLEYKMNDNISFSLAYFYHKYNEDANMEKERTLRFRTSIYF